jgi:hypothetical protein
MVVGKINPHLPLVPAFLDLEYQRSMSKLTVLLPRATPNSGVLPSSLFLYGNTLS